MKKQNQNLEKRVRNKSTVISVDNDTFIRVLLSPILSNAATSAWRPRA